MTMNTTPLLARELVAEGTMAFHFERPPGFDFKPGQAMDVVPGADLASTQPEARHAFSIVSAPCQNELLIATRMRGSTSKDALAALPAGAQVTLDGPFGSLGLHKATARAGVFIAGGRGITPFMSMLRHAAQQQTPQDLLLLYSNHRPEDAAFLSELQQLETVNARFHMAATMTQRDRSSQPWAPSIAASCSVPSAICPRPSSTSPGRRPWSRPCDRCWPARASMKTMCAVRSFTATEPRPDQGLQTCFPRSPPP